VDEFSQRWLSDYARPAPSTQTSYRYALARFRKDFGGPARSSARRRSGGPRPSPTSSTAPSARCSPTPGATVSSPRIRSPSFGSRCPRAGGGSRCSRKTASSLWPTRRSRSMARTSGRRCDRLSWSRALWGFAPASAAAWNGRICARAISRFAARAKGNMGPPKNGEPRLCVVPPPARDALAVVPRFVDQPAVFLTPRLKRFSKGAIHRYFGVVRAAYGRAELDFYELRHACATLLLERGLAGGRRDPARPHRRRHPGQQALRPPIRGACAGQDRGGVCSRTGRKLVAGVEKPPSSRRFACSKLTLSADAPAVHLAAVATRNGVGG
jgi:hypothetical protein